MGLSLTTEEVRTRVKQLYHQDVELISEYKNKRSLVSMRCNDCGHIWETKGSSILYLGSHCVEKHCPNCGNHSANMKNGVILNCAYCGKEVYRTPSRVALSQTGFFYCSRECGNLHKNVLRNDNGEWNDTSNYRRTAFVAYPHKCAICGYNEDTRILEVHHLDENRSNNKFDNLMILCPICHRKITLKYYELRDNTLIKIR